MEWNVINDYNLDGTDMPNDFEYRRPLNQNKMSKIFKNGKRVHYWSACYNRVVTDKVESYDTKLDMYYLSSSMDYFVFGSLYTNLRTLKKSL